ncbi:hypothetical protein C8R42DRAFT_594361, partial [Lentinula raphanica]
HVGTMNQAGFNMGARDCRVFGCAKSFTSKKLTSEAMANHDDDIIGAVSLFWSMANALLPSDVTQVIHDYMDSEELPSLQTRNVAPESGFTIHIDNQDFFFPYAERSPPEVYINKGYAA